jgi:exonuclease SbcC
MLQKANIKNFLSHENSSIEFVPGFNIIVGETKAGKSAILQALNWLFTNRPVGQPFLSHWGGETNVSITTIQGRRIWRVKGEGINEYGMDKERFQQDKTASIPQEILKELNMNDINFQSQFQTHFLLGQTPASVAEHYNEITHLDLFDQGRKNIQKWISHIDQEVKTHQIELKENKDNLEKYDHLPDVEKKVERLEELEKIAQSLSSGIENIDSLIDSVERANSLIAQEKQNLELEVPVNALLKLVDKKDSIKEQITQLEDIISSISKYEIAIQREKKVVGGEKKFNAVFGLVSKRKETSTKIEGLNRLIQTIGSLKDTTEKQQGKLDEMMSVYNQHAGKVCPLCGQGVIEHVK